MHKERWSQRIGGRPKVMKLEFVFVLAEIIQVSDSTAWVRFASGNVWSLSQVSMDGMGLGLGAFRNIRQAHTSAQAPKVATKISNL